MPTVLIGPSPIRHQPGVFRQVLEAAGFQTIDPPGGDVLSEDVLRAFLPECDALIAGGERIDAELLDLAPKLRVIARTGVGFDAIDVSSATSRGVAVTITPGTNHESVAEHAFALILAVSRRVVENHQIIQNGGWDRSIVLPVRGRSIGLVGLGRIGQAMVPRAQAFGMHILGFDPMIDPDRDARLRIELKTLDALLAEADVVSLHLPLGPSTARLFDASRFATMKRGSILINTSRGGLIDEAALLDALRSGHLAGAGLDVFATEPPLPDHPLCAMPQVVASPHIAGVDQLAMAQMAEMAARCVVELFQGRWPDGCVVNEGLKTSWSELRINK